MLRLLAGVMVALGTCVGTLHGRQYAESSWDLQARHPSSGARDHSWTFVSDCGGTGTHNADNSLTITGGNQNVAGKSEFTMVVPVGATIGLGWSLPNASTYSSTDYGAWDYCYLRLNGADLVVRTNDQQGIITFDHPPPGSSDMVWFNVKRGDIVTFGVHTADGAWGPGVLAFKPWTIIDSGFRAFEWSVERDPPSVGGHVTLPTTTDALQIVGGNSGVAGWVGVKASVPARAWWWLTGWYGSVDVGTWDVAYFCRANAPSPWTLPLVPDPGFADNVRQAYFWFVPWLTRNYGVPLNPGVYTVDGAMGPGILDMHRVTVRTHPEFMRFFPWEFHSTAEGDTGHMTLGPTALQEITANGAEDTMNLITGTPGIWTPGVTEFRMVCPAPLWIELDAEYVEVGPSNAGYSYYSINGQEFLLAAGNNAAINARFGVRKGQTLALGARLTAGAPGGTQLVIKRFRAFMHEPCYADCNDDGWLNAGDLACFNAAYMQGNKMYADCDRDGAVWAADVACFNTKFAQGCP